MARKRIAEDHSLRRNEIIQTAWKLVSARGFETMSIQELIDALGMSKGAFYHYFASKTDLLDGMVETLLEDSWRQVASVSERGDLSSTARFIEFLKQTTLWKTANQAKYRGILAMWYADANLALRDRVHRRSYDVYLPVMREIFDAGYNSGEFKRQFTDQSALLLYSAMAGLGDHIARRMLALPAHASRTEKDALLEEIYRVNLLLCETFEWLTGAEPGSLTFFDRELMRNWVESQ